MTKNSLHECHQLLHDVMADAFHTETILFEEPYQDLSRIDQGLRASVWTDYTDNSGVIPFSDPSVKYRMLIIKSNLGFYNVLVFFCHSETPDFISIGPFRDEELSANYYTQILKEARLAPSILQGIKYRYERMAYANPEVITKLTKHIISAFFEDFKKVPIEFVEYSEQNRKAVVNPDVLKRYSTEFTEKYKSTMFTFLNLIKQGDAERAKETLRQFLLENQLLGGKNMHEDKHILHMLNDYCHLALLDTPVHPSYIMTQAFSLKARIDDTMSMSKLQQMANDICRKYCLLVQNFSNPEYSRLTKEVIDYIRLHLDEELSLQYLADTFHKNASVLSATFSKETGESLTKFIQKQRIHEAIRLFNSTSLSVSEVAVAIGYQDFSYFSKIFSREIGCSPREYKTKRMVVSPSRSVIE